jgi:RHS repeat-associated protein
LGASYRYDAYGNLLSKSGSLADTNVYRFSSKQYQQIDPSAPSLPGLYYYGYRFYAPGVQRWLNRDPLGEVPSINLYGFVGNAPTGIVDPFGRDYRGYNLICAARCQREYGHCISNLQVPAKWALGILVVFKCTGKVPALAGLGWGFGVGEGINFGSCAASLMGCLSGCPPPLPYPMPPYGQGCSICPVNSPPVY